MEEHREKVHGLTRVVMATPVLKIKESLEENEIVEIQESAAEVPKEARKVARKSTKPPRNPQQESPENPEENPDLNVRPLKPED